MPAAGSKGPHAGNPVAAFAFDRANPGTWSPGQHRARIAEDRPRHGEVEIGGRHRAAAGLAEAPGRGGIGFGDGFDDVEEGDGIGFDPVGRARQQQAEQLRVVQPVEQRRWQPARIFDVVGSGRDIGADGLGPGDHRPVACEIGRLCDRSVQGYVCHTLAVMAFPRAIVHCWAGRRACAPPPRQANVPPQPTASPWRRGARLRGTIWMCVPSGTMRSK